jgi:hypothetical protein
MNPPAMTEQADATGEVLDRGSTLKAAWRSPPAQRRYQRPPRTAIINTTSPAKWAVGALDRRAGSSVRFQLSERAGPHLTAFNSHLDGTFGRGRNGASGAS